MQWYLYSTVVAKRKMKDENSKSREVRNRWLPLVYEAPGTFVIVTVQVWKRMLVRHSLASLRGILTFVTGYFGHFGEFMIS